MNLYYNFFKHRLITMWLFLFLIPIGCRDVIPDKSIGELESGSESHITLSPQSDPKLQVTLEPGDIIDIKFFQVPELNETQMVLPNGTITLQLVNEVYVQGKTPAQIRDELIRLYKSKLKKTEISVIVRDLPGRVVYVGGEVKNPGVIEMPGRLTALEAIMKAGGFNLEFAKVKKVIVIRQNDRKRQRFLLNLKTVLAGKTIPEPFYLEPRDSVIVPRY